MKLSLRDLLTGAFMLALITATRAYGYLLFHSLVEIFSVVIAFSIFLIAWNSRESMDNDFLLFLGIVYFFVGITDLLHALAYKGMGVFPAFDSNLPTQLWIAARYLESTGLALSTLFLKRRVNLSLTLPLYAAATSAALASIYLGAFPDCYVEGVGLTAFKIASEYLIVAILGASILRMYRLRALFERSVFLLVTSAIVVTMFSELSFTLYVDVYGAFNMLGHLLKLVSFYLIYLSVVKTGIAAPHALLFHATKSSEERLRKAVEEKTRELMKLQERVLEVERNVAFGELASSVIHDMKTPMQTLLNLVYLLRESGAAKEDQNLNELLNKVESQIEYLKGVTSELKSFSKPMNPKIAPVDLNDVLHRAFMSVEVPSNIQVGMRVPEGLPKVLADPIFLQRVFTNLIVNAIEAMPRGGNLRVVADKEGSHVVVSVTDTGVGIHPDDQGKIFSTRFTTKKGGTGLGLSISKRLLESIGGSIEFTSAPEKGTTFSVRLPTAE